MTQSLHVGVVPREGRRRLGGLKFFCCRRKFWILVPLLLLILFAHQWYTITRPALAADTWLTNKRDARPPVFSDQTCSFLQVEQRSVSECINKLNKRSCVPLELYDPIVVGRGEILPGSSNAYLVRSVQDSARSPGKTSGRLQVFQTNGLLVVEYTVSKLHNYIHRAKKPIVVFANNDLPITNVVVLLVRMDSTGSPRAWFRMWYNRVVGGL